MFAWSLKNSCLEASKQHNKSPKRKQSVKAGKTIRKVSRRVCTPGTKVRTLNKEVESIEKFLDKQFQEKCNMSGNTIESTTPSKEKITHESGYKLRQRNESYRQSLQNSQKAVKQPSEAVISESIREQIQEEGGNTSFDTIESEESSSNLVLNTDSRQDQQKDEDEMGSIEDLLPPRELIKRELFDSKNTAAKLDCVFESINRVYAFHAQVNARVKSLEFAVFDPEDGVLPQIKNVADYAKGSEKRVDTLAKQMISLRKELDITKGLVHKQNKQIAALKEKQVNLIARSMASNITIAGIKHDVPGDDDPKILVLDFLERELGVQLQDHEDIPIAHRLGAYAKGQHRPIVFRCPDSLKKRIFENTKKLAGKNFSVNQQLPESLAEKKKEIRYKIKQVQKAEEGKEDHAKSKFLVRNNKLYINGQLQRKKIFPPTVDRLFVNDTEEKTMEKIKLLFSKPKSSKGSSFTAAACAVENMNDVHLAYKKLYREFPAADHISVTCVVAGEEAHEDDSEFGAGVRLLEVIRASHLGDIAIFMIRVFGGELIGPMRFNYIREVAEEALSKLA